jgi:hypothetical protein
VCGKARRCSTAVSHLPFLHHHFAHCASKSTCRDFLLFLRAAFWEGLVTPRTVQLTASQSCDFLLKHCLAHVDTRSLLLFERRSLQNYTMLFGGPTCPFSHLQRFLACHRALCLAKFKPDTTSTERALRVRLARVVPVGIYL